VPPPSRDHAVIGEDRPFQHRFWLAQRAAWLLLAVLIAASMLGLIGGTGPFASRTVSDAAVSIDYPAILRRQAPNTFTFTLAHPVTDTVIHFDHDFLRTFTIMAMIPDAASSFATADGVAYRFELRGEGPATLRVDVIAEDPAHRDYRIVTNGRLALLTSTVLP
jgi:hypothetical protein